jgi:RimJ/RimL family protein N-acetyltransferase
MELLFIHQLETNQVATLRNILQNPRVYMWLRNGAIYSDKDIANLITYSQQDAKKMWNKRDYFYWAIIVNARVVGLIGLHPALHEATRSLGRECLQITYAIDPNEQGKGYATQAMRMLCNNNDLINLTRRCIISIVRVDNFGSLRVMRHIANLFNECKLKIKKNRVEYVLFEMQPII